MNSVTVVNKLLETDNPDDPRAYVGYYVKSLRQKRDIVVELLKQYAVRKRWLDYNRVSVTFPKTINLQYIFRQHGVPARSVTGISNSVNNYHLQFYWADGDLDSFI